MGLAAPSGKPEAFRKTGRQSRVRPAGEFFHTFCGAGILLTPP